MRVLKTLSSQASQRARHIARLSIASDQVHIRCANTGMILLSRQTKMSSRLSDDEQPLTCLSPLLAVLHCRTHVSAGVDICVHIKMYCEP